jgi:hypothetical protein
MFWYYKGVQRVCIVDFDVHHGNGSEACVRALIPSVEQSYVTNPVAFGETRAFSECPRRLRSVAEVC